MASPMAVTAPSASASSCAAQAELVNGRQRYAMKKSYSIEVTFTLTFSLTFSIVQLTFSSTFCAKKTVRFVVPSD